MQVWLQPMYEVVRRWQNAGEIRVYGMDKPTVVAADWNYFPLLYCGDIVTD